MIRVAAVGDVHAGDDSCGTLAAAWTDVGQHADLLLVAGDLTRRGDAAEARVLADEIREAAAAVPVVAVLGNHDVHGDEEKAIRTTIERAGVRVLDGDAEVVDVAGTTVGVAGAIGFGGGFAGASASDFGEPEMKAFVGRTRDHAHRLETALGELTTDVRIALLHYSPTAATLTGERPELYPFLGSYVLGEAIDRAGADLVVHGHAHVGMEKGVTAGGTHVRNVAQPVIRTAYRVYEIGS